MSARKPKFHRGQVVAYRNSAHLTRIVEVHAPGSGIYKCESVTVEWPERYKGATVEIIASSLRPLTKRESRAGKKGRGR